MSQHISVDPDGDLKLELGSVEAIQNYDNGTSVKCEATTVTVSSVVLCLVSPVFKAMLRGKYKEGVGLANRDPLSPYVMALPEDDPEATVILCKILHFHRSKIDRPTPICMERLAYLCDKYQCTQALRDVGALWLRDWLVSAQQVEPSIDDICRLLIFSYIMDLPYEFEFVAWNLFLLHKGPLLGSHTQAVILLDHPLLRHDLAVHLDQKRSEVNQEIYQGIMAPVRTQWKTTSKDCFGAAKAIAHYMSEVARAGLLPQSLDFADIRLCDLVAKVACLKWKDVSDFGCRANYCNCTKEVKYNLYGGLKGAVDSIKKRSGSLVCLDCIKTEGLSRANNKCLITHAL